MYYGSFNINITAKYGVICKRWPLPNFVSPADLKTRNEVEILFHAWSTNTTTFRRLTNAELDEWQEQRFQEALDIQLDRNGGAGAGDVDADEDGMYEGGSGLGTQQPPTPASSSSTPTTAFIMHDPSSHTSRPKASKAVNAVTSANGDPIVSSHKKRKTRSDAGIKRGPRRKVVAASG